jgi:hypothetical protein
MVLASKPVATLEVDPRSGGFKRSVSVMRLAARPVGAHSRRLVPFAARILRIALTIVVLPTPGPPVMTSTLAVRASRMAATWLSARAKPMRVSTQGGAQAWQRGDGPAQERGLGSGRAVTVRVRGAARNTRPFVSIFLTGGGGGKRR